MKSSKYILFFLLKAIFLYGLWFLIYDLWLKKDGSFDNWVIDNLVYWVEMLMSAFGYTIFVDYHKIGLHGASTYVMIGRGCNGVELFALFAGFILVFEGKWIHKLWFIPLGIIIIHFLNVLRIIGLIFSANVSSELLDINHKYTFTIVMYIVAFIGWMVWVKYFTKVSSKYK